MKKLALFCLILLFSSAALAMGYGALDRKARTLPIRQAQTKEQLVEQLTGDLDSDEAKARILASWMAFQIQRNGFEYQKLIQASNAGRPANPPLPNDIFKTRIGTPQEFADLYAELASMAGLQVATITGYAGWRVPSNRYEKPLMQTLEPVMNVVNRNSAANRLQRYASAWNAVKIGDEWKLVDTYWMVDGELRTGNEMSESQFKRFLEKRMRKTPSLSTVTQSKRIDDTFFFTRPRTFIRTHFPDDDQWQLLPSPKSWGSFTR